MIALTKEGWDLRDQAEQIPAAVCASLKIPPEEAAQLYDLLYKALGRLSPEGAFVSLEDLDLPPVLKSLCTGVPESAFRMDISSTELRQKEEHQAG